MITDSMRAKGMPEGKSELGGQTVYVKDGTARLEDGTIAGSVLTYIDAFRNIMKFTGCFFKRGSADEFRKPGKRIRTDTKR